MHPKSPLEQSIGDGMIKMIKNVMTTVSQANGTGVIATSKNKVGDPLEE